MTEQPIKPVRQPRVKKTVEAAPEAVSTPSPVEPMKNPKVEEAVINGLSFGILRN